MLEARHCIITNHKSITYAFQQKRDKLSPRQFNRLDFIAQFMTNIWHVSGQDVADAPSHVESIIAPPSYDTLAASQNSNDEPKMLLIVDHCPAARETTNLQCLCQETSAVRSSCCTTKSVPVCPRSVAPKHNHQPGGRTTTASHMTWTTRMFPCSLQHLSDRLHEGGGLCGSH
jgi:hypothetical protein